MDQSQRPCGQNQAGSASVVEGSDQGEEQGLGLKNLSVRALFRERLGELRSDAAHLDFTRCPASFRQLCYLLSRKDIVKPMPLTVLMQRRKTHSSLSDASSAWFDSGAGKA